MVNPLVQLVEKYGGKITATYYEGDVDAIINHYPVKLFETSFGYVMEVPALDRSHAFNTFEELEEAVYTLTKLS